MVAIMNMEKKLVGQHDLTGFPKYWMASLIGTFGILSL
ncbi:hypothetical protein NBRC111894_3778 [Sporolactobacillus inulinus]|uniref:Uncharacterized protein n=1 Tax=Sporolactobacillus inulinus TaxID=2078 RepID=A0A4Y1ZH50_9BACL|nr:hypothetical protein NBRC111894_3778 [Sporolactobacillus inulinus]